MEIGRGIRRIGTGMVNAYLLEESGAVTIIDAGLPGYWADLPPELAAMRRSLDDVRAVVLTHGHSDHIGFAERIRRERSVGVRVHELDAALARGDVPNPGGGAGPISIGPLLAFLLYSARKGGLREQRLSEVISYGDGATLDLPGSPRVIHLPGHTPGSAALHVSSHSALFVGDALATLSVASGRTGPQVAPFTADPRQAVESLRRLEGVEADLVLPGHGLPWTGGVGEAIERVRAGAASGAKA
jgi:glyoxylase-like metal-dependent hydrolase (beta-lactamase superfamily II)